MKSLLISASLILFLISQSIAQKDPVAREILDAMSNKYQQIPAFRATFKNTMENETEGINEGFNGRITVKGEKYRLIMDQYEILFDGQDRWTYMKEDNEVQVSSFDPNEEADDINNISKIFTMYKSGFKYLFIESRDNGTIDVVDLVPEDTSKDIFKIRMEIAKDRSLKSFKMFDKSGTRYVYTITKFEEDGSITDGAFRFKASDYPDAEVIDFR